MNGWGEMDHHELEQRETDPVQVVCRFLFRRPLRLKPTGRTLVSRATRKRRTQSNRTIHEAHLRLLVVFVCSSSRANLSRACPGLCLRSVSPLASDTLAHGYRPLDDGGERREGLGLLRFPSAAAAVPTTSSPYKWCSCGVFWPPLVVIVAVLVERALAALARPLALARYFSSGRSGS